jgi:hypothetical protein
MFGGGGTLAWQFNLRCSSSCFILLTCVCVFCTLWVEPFVDCKHKREAMRMLLLLLVLCVFFLFFFGVIIFCLLDISLHASKDPLLPPPLLPPFSSSFFCV